MSSTTVGPTEATRRIRQAIDRIPRVRFNNLPTPLQKAERLSRELGIDLTIKRDDLCETFGGNKSRTLEFRLAEALQLDPDPLILAVEAISNTAPATAKICNRLGVPLVMVLRDQPETNLQGNLFLDHLFGVEIRRFAGAGLKASNPYVDQMVEAYQGEGRNPVVLNRVPSFFGYGPSVAYLEALLEVHEDAEGGEPAPDHIYICSTGKSQAGVLAGSKLLNYDSRVVGVTPHGKPSVEKIVDAVQGLATKLELDIPVEAGAVHNDTRHLGPGYGVTTPESIEAIRMVARLEGLLLDADRTAKSMAALLADVRDGVIKPGERVLFFHTGGVASLFAHADELLQAVRAQW